MIFLQHLIHHKMEAHVIILCLINAQCLVFQLKHYKKEVFEIICLLLFHSKTHFFMAYTFSLSLVFITQSYFSVPKDVRLNSTHYLIMKIYDG